MSLPAPNLDDLRFQRDLVDEARRRIIHYCPEWTEYNLSDPGITLIELFAWMTELTVYRLNRVPEKNYIKFLELLGMQLSPAAAAKTELTFWLSAGLPFSPGDKQTVTIPQGYEVASDSNAENVIFTTEAPLEIVPPLLAHLRKESEFNRNFASRLGLETFYPFDADTPQAGDTFYLGFDPANNISGHILRLEFICEPTEAVGIRREDPPWVWECLMPDGTWLELAPSNADGEKDTTGGLNNELGSLVLYLPTACKETNLYGVPAFWLRCRIEQRNPFQGMYSESPRVRHINPYSIGAAVPSVHSVLVKAEELGNSTGEPGQSFSLRHSPVLKLLQGEWLEVQENQAGEVVFVPWQEVEDFSRSTRFDRHYVLDHANGTVHFGASVRQSNGAILQYGRLPESGRRVRMSGYRQGGGVQGNLPIGSLTQMISPLAYVTRVNNRTRALGGRDQESLEELKLRAQRELQSQRRAVTAADFEHIALQTSRSISRVRCLPATSSQGTSGTVTVVVVPAVPEALMAGNLASLHVQDSLRQEVQAALDSARLMTTVLRVATPRYIGVGVKARIIPQPYIQPAQVERDVRLELARFLSPLPLDDKQPLLLEGEKWEGWQFGRDLFKAEIISLIQQVPNVKYVVDVEVYSRPVNPVEELEKAPEPALPVQSVEQVLQVPDDTLVCSLDHQIEVLNVQDLYQKGK